MAIKDKILIEVDEDSEMLKVSGMPTTNGLGNYWDFNTFDWIKMIEELGNKYGFDVKVEYKKIKL